KMLTLACRFGYLAPEESIEQWNADAIIDHPEETLQWI
ncbi:MAG TPA: phosphoglycolate phosphatase, partial [Gammaproteobacteria bacterium]|nr:phosphoglycolate phosphatase [Gammaproteobacteria bacterium]